MTLGRSKMLKVRNLWVVRGEVYQTKTLESQKKLGLVKI